MTADTPSVGDEATGSLVVAPEHFASRVVDVAPDVFATPALGALVERTAAQWLQQYVGPEQMSVGSQLTIQHTAATPQGKQITVTVRLAEAEPPRYDFTWTARDEAEEIGSGTHQRFVVERERFMRRLDRKR